MWIRLSFRSPYLTYENCSIASATTPTRARLWSSSRTVSIGFGNSNRSSLKARAGLSQTSEAAGVERRAQIFEAGVAKKGDDRRVLAEPHAERDRGDEVRAGRSPGEQRLRARQPTRHRHRRLGRDGGDFVGNGRVPQRNHETGADALDLVDPRPSAREDGGLARLDRGNMDIRLLSAQGLGDAAHARGSPGALHEGIDPAVRLSPD